MSKVSVIIPVYNGEKYISKAIDSALSQTYRDVEIIIIDDASIDGTEGLVLKNYSNLIGNEIIYFKNKHNMERAFSRNKGYELSTGNYIFFLDYDDEWERDYIEDALKVFHDGHYDIVYSFQRTFIDENSEVIKVSRKPLGKDIGKIIFASSVGYPTATAFRRNSFPKYVDRYIPREDWEIFIRSSLNDLKIRILDNNKVKIRAHEERTSKNVFFWSSTLKVYEDCYKKIPHQYRSYFLFHIGDICLRFGDIGRGWKFIMRSIEKDTKIILDKRKFLNIIKRGFRIDKYFRFFKEREFYIET